MKILKIKIKNINCLLGEWEIDFQLPPLSQAGLFAITGPTGSGKSTILDAITLALFNKIPRFESDTISKNFIEKSGSIITRNETDSFVEVEYSCTEGIYRSKWSIATNKRGGLRETDMELIDVSTNKPILSGKKEVAKKNTELIGLTYDQFIKSILLAQGEFARFLKSKKDERGKLLEDITGMTVYRELGKRAFEKFKEKNEIIKSRSDIIQSEEEQLLSKEKEHELDQFIQTVNKEILDGESNRATIEKAIEIKNRIQAVENEIEKYSQEEEQVNKMLDAFNEKNDQRIFKHERLLPHLNAIRNYLNIHNSIKNINEEIQRKGPELEHKKRAVNETLNAIGVLTGSKVEAQNGIKVLTDFRDRVIFYTTKRINAENALSQQKIKFAIHLKKPMFIHYKSYETGDKIDELKSKLSKEIASIKSSTVDLVNQTKIKTHDIDKQKEALSESLRAMEDLKNLVENFAENQRKFNKKETQIEEVSTLISNGEPRLESIISAKNLVSLKINEVREKREKKLREKNLEEDRELLKQDEPCPLCGSLHHPYVHEYFNNVTELTKELQSLESQEKKFETERQKLQNEISTYSGIRETLQKENNGIKIEMAGQKNKVAARKEQLKIEKVGNVHSIEVAKTALEKSIESISRFEKLDSDKKELEDFKESVDELSLRIIEYGKAKSELELRYTGNNIRNDCDLLSRQLKELTDAIQSIDAILNSNKTQVNELYEQQNEIEVTLKNILKSFGYSDILSSFIDILPDTEFNILKQQFSELQGKLNNVKGLIKSANERRTQLLPADNTNLSKDQLLEEHILTLQKLKHDTENLTEYRAQKVQNDTRKTRIDKLRQQVDET
ncbi:MAG: AAA family ATPase, partial [Bacteroidota bacterium]|nr:AAA family ATPase [Bacteroidota bacterium]